MKRKASTDGTCGPPTNRPYALLGAGRLAASVWKSGREDIGWQYRFNLFRMSQANGRVTQRFSPGDVADLVKLAQVLAFTLADDGCLDAALRADLHHLATKLDEVIPLQENRPARHGEGNG